MSPPKGQEEKARRFYNAHNEYLQYLVIIGISGLVTYVGFLTASGWLLLSVGMAACR
ncbi:MAG: hypothetical protein HFG64_05530 [Lachnospiraceae bacterium]|nr:hypothetical protein [Lachnospiraceae bacterium]